MKNWKWNDGKCLLCAKETEEYASIFANYEDENEEKEYKVSMCESCKEKLDYPSFLMSTTAMIENHVDENRKKPATPE